MYRDSNQQLFLKENLGVQDPLFSKKKGTFGPQKIDQK